MVFLIWHSESTAAVVTALQTDRARGLSTEACGQRRAAAEAAHTSGSSARAFGRRFAARLKSPEVVLLLAAALVTLAFSLYRWFAGYGDLRWQEAALVAVLALVRCFVSVLGDGRAAAEMKRLKVLAAPIVRVWRDGVQITLPATELLPGDVIEVEAGDLLSADCRLLRSSALRCDESSLTGDTLPVSKDAEAVVPAIAPLAERRNMLYAGCTVLHGHGRAVVVEIGDATEAGKNAALRRRETGGVLPVQQELTRVGQKLRVPFAVLALVLLVLSLIARTGVLRSLLLALSFAVAAMPGEWSSFVSPALAGAVRRMARRGAVVHRAGAVERLGRVSVLCSDKTGSFTQGDMTLVRAFVGDHMVKLDDNPLANDVSTLLQLATLCTEDGDAGDATDAALIAYTARHDMERDKLIAAYPRLGEIPFDSDRRRMTAVHLIEGRHVVIVKGAAETLLPLCAGVPEELHDAEAFMEAGALRVLAVAYKYIDEMPTHCFAEELEQGLNFLGLLGLSDPLRPDAVEAVADCRRAGIRPVMLTGDNLATASALADKLGLLSDAGEAIGGEALAALSDEEVQRDGTRYRVCARVSPTDKVRIVQAWQKQGAVVALTGDGTADIPALQTADVGCAMSRGRADAAVATADVVLTDDRFSTLVDAVREGRALLLHLQHMTQYWFARHISAVFLIAAALIGWGRTPLSPALLLWVSTVTGAAATFGMSADPAGRDALSRAPRAYADWRRLGGAGLGIGGGVLTGVCALVALAVGSTLAVGLSMALAVFALGQVTLLLCFRSSRPLYGSLRGGYTFIAAVAEAALLLPLWLVPALREACGLAALNAGEWGAVVWLAFLPFLLIELGKIVYALCRRGARA